MYRQYYGLRDLPFSITPNTSFFFAHQAHQEALNTLLLTVRSGEGFIKVVGEVGTGKTLLCRKFLNSLENQKATTAYIPNPCLGPISLLLGVADELGIEYPPDVKQHHLIKLMTKFLLDVHAKGGFVVLCLDEAQALPIQTLETLRLFTNLETERRKLLQVVLFGQPELDQKLDNPSIRQLKQRITFSCYLTPLTRDEVEFYIAHRLNIAGYSGPRLFTSQAIKRLHRASGGVPRLINILAHKALMLGYGEGAKLISDRHIRLAVRDTQSTQNPRSLGQRLKRYVFGGLFTTLLLCTTILAGFYLP